MSDTLWTRPFCGKWLLFNVLISSISFTSLFWFVSLTKLMCFFVSLRFWAWSIVTLYLCNCDCLPLNIYLIVFSFYFFLKVGYVIRLWWRYYFLFCSKYKYQAVVGMVLYVFFLGGRTLENRLTFVLSTHTMHINCNESKYVEWLLEHLWRLISQLLTRLECEHWAYKN